MQNIKISALNKIFTSKDNIYRIITTDNNTQYITDQICIWLFHDEKPCSDCNMVLGEEKDNSCKPDIITVAKMEMDYMNKISYSKVTSFTPGKHIHTEKTRKGTYKSTSKKCFLLKTEFNHTIINEKYYKSFTPDCEFYISDTAYEVNQYWNGEKYKTYHPVIVFGKSKVIGIICPMFEDDNNIFESL